MRFALLVLFGAGIIFLMPQAASALSCSGEAGWKNTDFSCDINYSDLGGSNLTTCQYRLYNVSTGYNTGWLTSIGTCSGTGGTLEASITVGADPKNCRDSGTDQCKLYARAIDSSNNIFETPEANPINSFEIDYAKPMVSANNQSSQWFTSREVTLSVSDATGSGLPASPGRYSWDTNNFNAACTTGGIGSYNNNDKVSVPQGSHRLYLCARDNAANVGNWDSGADQYRVDPIAPVYQSFLVNGVSCSSNGPVFCPATVTATGTINFTWGVSDSGGSGLQRHELWRARDAAENGGNWVWQNIQPNIAPGTFSTTDTPPNSGTWWYGMHTVDNALHTDNFYNCITEGGEHICGGVSSDTLDPRTARGPIKVIYGDQTAPTINSFSISPTTWTNGNVTVTWTASDNTGGSGIQEVEVWRAPDNNGSPGTWSNIKDNASSPFVDSPPDGKWWYGIHVTDVTGNCIKEDTSGLDKGHCGGVGSDSFDTRADKGPLQALVDKTPPPTPTNLQPTGTVTSTNVLFLWSGVTDTSGIPNYRLQVDQESQFNSPFEIDASPTVPSYNSAVGNGTRYWRVWAVDGAGNNGSSASASFNHQPNEPPEAQIGCSPSNCTIIAGQSLTFHSNNSSDPDGSGDITAAEWDILNYGNVPDATCTSPILCNYTLPTSTPANTYTMRLKVGDAAGATDTDDKIFIVQPDVTAPTIGSFAVSPTTWTSGNITVSWTASDSHSGIQEVEVWRAPDSGGSPGTWTNIKDNAVSPFVDSPADGQWWYGIHVTDKTGNCIKEDTSQADKGHCGGVASDGLDTRTDRGPLKAQVDKTAPSTPANLSPTGTVATDCIDFDWNDVTDISGVPNYRFQVDNNQNFNNPEIDVSPASSTYSSCAVADGTQYWRVWAVNGVSLQGQSASAQIDHQPNEPPTASFNCTPGNCTVYNTEILTFNNNSSDPDGSSDISTSEWDILSYGSAPDASCSGKCNHTLQPISPNTYTMQLKVIDSAGATDTDTRSFTVKRDIVAGFMCSLDNVNFVACASLSGQISQEETLYLKDSSVLSEYTVVSQGASSVTSRTWKINGTPFGGNNANPSTAIPTQGTVTLELTAQDNQGRSDTQTHTLNPQLPFPEFQEISPF